MRVNYIGRKTDQPYHVTYFDGTNKTYAVVSGKNFLEAVARAFESIAFEKRATTIIVGIKEWDT
jgi:hypothetical protein